MSTDRKRLTSAIQRIAREDPEIRKLLGESENKGGKAASSGVGSSDAESDRQCCDGSVSDNANPGTATRDPDAEDAGQEGGLDDDDPARLDMGQGTLSGVTDCTTGEPVCFHGGGFIPPDGWDGPNDPPPDPMFELGTYWRWGYSIDDVDYGPFLSATPPDLCVYMGTCSDFGCTRDTSLFACSGEDGIEYAAQRSDYSCDSPFPDDSADDVAIACPDSAPLLDSWPTDSCTNLAIKNGAIVGSKYDPENDGSYSKPRPEIQLCDANGNQISIRPAGTGVLPTGEQTSVPERITGGWKTFNTINDNGYLYDSSGKQIAHIAGSEYSDPNI